MITAGDYSIAADRPANKAFLAAWDREGLWRQSDPGFPLGRWLGRMAMVYDLIKRPRASSQAMRRSSSSHTWKTANSPRGPISIDPATRDIVQNIYMRRTEMKDGKLANIEFDTIPNVKDPWKELNPMK